MSVWDASVHGKQARWDGFGYVFLIPPLAHAHKREAILNACVHVVRNVVKVCRHQNIASRRGVLELCLTTLQLTEGVQLTDKKPSAGTHDTRGLTEDGVQVLDVFEYERADNEIDRGIDRAPLASEVSLLEAHIGRRDVGTDLTPVEFEQQRLEGQSAVALR